MLCVFTWDLTCPRQRPAWAHTHSLVHLYEAMYAHPHTCMWVCTRVGARRGNAPARTRSARLMKYSSFNFVRSRRVPPPAVRVFLCLRYYSSLTSLIIRPRPFFNCLTSLWVFFVLCSSISVFIPSFSSYLYILLFLLSSLIFLLLDFLYLFRFFLLFC